MSEENKETKSENPVSGEKMAVILVRGFIRVNKKVVDTCKMLTLYRKNYCTLVDKKDFGMVNKIKDYVTFGEIDKETEKLLIEKKGEMKKGRDGKDVMKRFFRLNPPKKGFGRKGIKVSFSKSGALGYRGNKINELIKRML